MRFSLKLAAIAVAMLTTLAAGNFAMAQTSEDLWKSLEKLPAAEREKKLLEGARKEGEMVWYTNSGIENATRYIQAFKKKYPFINANFWRSKTRQVTQRIVSEANAGRHLVDVIKPSTDLLPILLERNFIGRYDTPAAGDLSGPCQVAVLHQHELCLSRLCLQSAQGQLERRAEELGRIAEPEMER